MSGLLIYKENEPMARLELIIVIIIFLGLYVIYNINASDKCMSKGGTWLVREGKCLDIKERK
jgi:hypothetical protein